MNKLSDVPDLQLLTVPQLVFNEADWLILPPDFDTCYAYEDAASLILNSSFLVRKLVISSSTGWKALYFWV